MVSNESLYVDFFFFFPPSHPLSVAMATGVEDLVKKKKKAFKELPTFTDKFLDPFAPHFFFYFYFAK